jgi:hypothetical protein
MSGKVRSLIAKLGETVDYDFTVTNEGLVDVTVDENLPLLSEALKDSIGTRPPRGAPQDGPSTYWIDHAVTYLEARMEDGGREPFASGNATYLQLRNGAVEARYEFDAEEDEILDAVPAFEFLALLRAWRERVLAESPAADKRMPPPTKTRVMPGN